MDGNAFTHHWEAGRSRPDRRSSRQWGNPGKKERSVVRRRDGNQKWSDNRRWQAPCAPQVGAGPLRTGRSTSRHGRVRRERKVRHHEEVQNGTGYSPKVVSWGDLQKVGRERKSHRLRVSPIGLQRKAAIA